MKKTLEILTPEKALLYIKKNTAISTRVGDWGIESADVKDLSSTQQPFAVLDLALTELAEIKKRAEEVKRQILDMNSYGGKSVRNKIDYIIKGEKK